MMDFRRLGLAVIALLCTMGTGFVLSAPVLARDVHVFSGSFGEEGSEEGKLSHPFGIAVNETTHDVYVADRGNGRIEQFTSAGVFVRQFAPPGGFGVERSGEPSVLEVAVDNSASLLDPSADDVYVSDEVNKVVDKFSDTGSFEGQLTIGQGGEHLGETTGVAVDGNGVVWVVERLGGAYLDSFSDASVNVFLSRREVQANQHGLAVDADGRAYIQGAGLVEQLGQSGERAQFGSGRGGVAVDLTNNEVFFGEGESISAHNVEGRVVDRFGSGHLSENVGVAVDSSTHRVYATDAIADRVVFFDRVVVPDVSTGEEPTNLEHEGSVTLDGTVDPDGLPVTSCQFEYGTESSYGNTVPCEPSPGSGSAPVTVHADVSGLSLLTSYHYRLVASNANGSTAGIDRTFVAPKVARVDGESVSNVASSSATFAGVVDPGGADTIYRFEYGLTSSYGESVSGDAGAGVLDVDVGGHAQDLRPASTYHYRLVAESALGIVTGEDRTFVTQSAVSASGLPDGRAWEMVSPPNKQGAYLRTFSGGESLIQAASDGSSISYAATGPTEVEPPGNRAPERVQVLSTRGLDGWASRVIATPHDTTHTGIAGGHESEYKFFSSDLSLGLVEPQGAMPLSGEASERTSYLRHNGLCVSSPAECYQPLATVVDVTSEVKFGGEPQNVKGAFHFVGGTPDLGHVILGSQVALTAGGSPGLYEWSADRLTFLGEMQLGWRDSTVAHAVSGDGSRVVGNGVSKAGGDEGDLLMRDVADGTTSRLDVAEPGAAGGSGEAVFMTASSDASRVFFTDGARLTVNSTASLEPVRRDLYEFDTATGKLSDLSVDVNQGEHADVLKVLGASEDGSYVYFVANGDLAAGARPGDCELGPPSETVCNLYVAHDGTTMFVATLSGEDRNDYEWLTARVSPDGRWLAFMSDRSLTGYDNRDVSSGKPDEEVFLYHAATTAEASRLVCASCDPTGERPTGAFMPSGITLANNGEPPPLVNVGLIWDVRWLAATIPAWTEVEPGAPIYQSRYLSDSGMLFFNSNEALAAQDTNGTWDVYEYEPPGVGGCEQSSVTFSESSGGCIAPVSSGGSHEESVFLDASESGSDVFFLTAAGLASQDRDGALDVYDAHVCSAGSPCVPAQPVSPPPCSTGDACKAAPSPQPGIFGAPSSETFTGAGNTTASASTRGVAPKSLSVAQKLSRALKACRKRSSGRKRVVCERRARKRYVVKRAVGSRAGKQSSVRTGR